MSTIVEIHLLSDKMKMAVVPEKLQKLSKVRVGFYMKYASFVFRTLRKPSFQRFLGWMLKKENIEERIVRDVQVRILPFKRKNGNGLAGNCLTQKGRIRIYPRTLKFCQKLLQEFGRDNFLSYVKIRARATLVHELLHLKYEKDEGKVRELTEKYLTIFTKIGQRRIYKR